MSKDIMHITYYHMINALKEAESFYREYLLLRTNYPKVAAMSMDTAQKHLEMAKKWADLSCMLYKESTEEVKGWWCEIHEYNHKKFAEKYDEIIFKMKN